MYGDVFGNPIKMELLIEGSQVSGNCYYVEKGSNNHLILSGTNDKGNINLKETDVNGTLIGRFQGTMSDGVFHGTYSTSGAAMGFSVCEK